MTRKQCEKAQSEIRSVFHMRRDTLLKEGYTPVGEPKLMQGKAHDGTPYRFWYQQMCKEVGESHALGASQ